MHWNLTKAETDPVPQSGQQTYEEALRRNFLFAKLEDMVAWGQSHSVWPFNFGLSCCYVEMATVIGGWVLRFTRKRVNSSAMRRAPRKSGLPGSVGLSVTTRLAMPALGVDGWPCLANIGHA